VDGIEFTTSTLTLILSHYSYKAVNIVWHTCGNSSHFTAPYKLFYYYYYYYYYHHHQFCGKP